jgi:hypothetical protein
VAKDGQSIICEVFTLTGFRLRSPRGAEMKQVSEWQNKRFICIKSANPNENEYRPRKL